jgi:hypothetical protein
MLDLEAITIPGLNLAGGTFTLPIWLAGLVAALLILFLFLSIWRSGVVGILIFVALIAVGGGAFWTYTERERIDERRALENRLAEIRTYALATGSSLACLDGRSRDAVETGCERALFAGPESLAAAATYSAARLSLLADGLKFASQRDPVFETTFDNLRRALEQDRFGVVANVLIVDKGCTVDQCDAFVLLRDATRVRANIRDKTFDALVARYSPNWQTGAMRNGTTVTTGSPSNAAASAASSAAAAAAEPSPPPAAILAEPPTASPSAVAAAPTPPRRPAAAARPAQPRPTQAQRAPAQVPSPPRVQ